MKNLNIFLITLTFLFTTISCSKDNVSPSNSEGSTLSAEIDGEAFESTSASGEIDSDGVFAIGGNQNERGIVIGFFSDAEKSIEEGSYNSTGFDFECFANSETCAKIDYIPNSSTNPNTQKIYTTLTSGGQSAVTITSIDFKSGGFAIGTFSGRLVNILNSSDVVEITDGQFNIKID